MKPRQHCALYTRKSSEEGLDQAFNSLDAQREACEAYVKSQKSEGWRAIAARYDDGGFSGGSMERPALERLLADITAGKIAVVVVYKIDRLTRSLADFARMVELFDRHGVSFVSVTQAFNTTSSMGRLTLNVLLSFAQFEREVTGERIRDKIAASKAKGMWMGGNLPLGYDAPTGTSRALVVNQAEAATVRTIFNAYLELSSVHALQRRLAERGIRSKRRTTRAGRIIGGRPFSRGALFHLLRNRTYLGLIVHRDEAHQGLHAAIVDTALFDTVQARLDANARRHNARSDRVIRAPLTGRIFDLDGEPMSPSFTHGKRGQVYRYYVSAPLQQGRRPDEDSGIRRVPGPALEDVVSGVIRRIAPASAADPLALPVRVEVHAAVAAAPDAGDVACNLALAAGTRRDSGTRCRRWRTAPADSAGAHAPARRAELDNRRHKPRIATGPGPDQGAADGPCNARSRRRRSSRDRGRSPIAVSPPPGTTRLSCAGSATRHPRRAATPRPHTRAADAHADARALVRTGHPVRCPRDIRLVCRGDACQALITSLLRPC